MHIFWGCLTAAVGLLMFVCGTAKSEFIVYRLLAARSKILWGEGVHSFYQVSGAVVVVFGILLPVGAIKQSIDALA